MVRLAPVAALVCLLATVGPGIAQEQPAPELRIALNRLDPQPGGCRLTFVAANAMARGEVALVVEAVLFTRAGRVAQLSLFDFGALPEGRQRVRQFDVPGLGCDDLGQVLFNGVATCTGAEAADCAAALRPVSDVDGVEVVG
jgi:hypothetical protein